MKVRLLCAWCFLLFAASGEAFSTTAIVPADDSLIIGARAIVTGRVLSVTSSFGPGRTDLFTYVKVAVDEVLKGDISGSTIVLREPGGIDGNIIGIVFGAPEFSRGQRVLLYLDTWPDGSPRVYQMFLGRFTIERDPATGRRIVSRGAASADVDISGRSAAGPITDRMELDSYKQMVRDRLAVNMRRSERFQADFYKGIRMLPAPPEYTAARGNALAPEFTLFPFHGRWFEPDHAQPIVYTFNPQNEFLPNAVHDAQVAMAAWTALSSVPLNLQLGAVGDACLSTDNATIIFNNCDGRQSPSPNCDSILAVSGLYLDATQTEVINGVKFEKVTGAFMSFNPNAACNFVNDCDLQETLTHELGHSLGLGHSWQPSFGGMPTPIELDATMYFAAHFDGRCASLHADDLAGIQSIYPLASAGILIAAVSSAPTGTVGAAYTLQLTATGGTAPYIWSLAPGKGTLPAGLSISSAGLISGTPSGAGTSSFNAQLLDSAGNGAQVTIAITINVLPLSLLTTALRAAVKGSNFSEQLIAQGGIPPYSWSISGGALPQGITIDLTTGTLSGTASQTGTFPFTTLVSDSTGHTASQNLQLLVVGQDAVPSISAVRYRASSGKLLIRGQQFDPSASLTIDGQATNAHVASSGLITGKGIILSTGSHELAVVNPNGVASAPFTLTVN